MKTKRLLENWEMIGSTPKPDRTCDLNEAMRGERIPVGKPVTALEALIHAGRVSGSILEDGEAEYCAWVAESDWLYVCRFAAPAAQGESFLYFHGLDTDCDIWLNGEKLAEHRTMYLPLRLPVTGRLLADNLLQVYFYSPAATYRWHEANMPEEWMGIVSPAAMMRKPPCDLFRNYLGVTPHYASVGFFGDTVLETVEYAELRETGYGYRLDSRLAAATVSLSARVHVLPGKQAEARLRLLAPDGEAVWEQAVPLSAGEAETVEASFVLERPELWWPIGHGPQPLYKAVFEVWCGGVLCDAATRQTGFRQVDLVGDLFFRINGRVIRLWGANIATMGSVSHRENPDMARFLLEKAVLCNCNLLRIWGPGEPVDDEFYDVADCLGMLIWQDFYIEPSQLPDTPAYMAIFRAEAEHLILRLRSHPSLLLWCGSNESLHMLDYFSETARIGIPELLEGVFPELCARLDPGRYYHVSCPAGGLYANDPSVGDTHGSHCMMSFLPGERYAVFFSEHIVTAPPELKSLRRFVPEGDIWPEGYSDIADYGRANRLPPALERRGNDTVPHKLGPVERFYDATDAESLVYKLTAAAGYAYEELIGRQRRGKPAHDARGPRRSNGYMAWKFNNTWPQFYCGLVDYYGESHITYYSVRRALQPLLLQFEVDDHIHVWAVNDTPEDVAGILRVRLFRLSENRVIREFSCPAAVLAGESVILTDLDRLGHFRRDCVLHASLEDAGVQLARAVGCVDMERHLPFPQAKVQLAVEGSELCVTTDSFARCVELSGISESGDAFGWHFEDNYFDLAPFETKTVKILGKHRCGKIQAKAHYSAHTDEVYWSRPEQ